MGRVVLLTAFVTYVTGAIIGVVTAGERIVGVDISARTVADAADAFPRKYAKAASPHGGRRLAARAAAEGLG